MTFVIYLEPKAQQRFRMASRGGHAFSYKAKGQKLNEDKLVTLMLPHRPHVPYQGPLMLSVVCYLPIPQSKSKKWRQAASEGVIRPTTKPDLSNLIKNLEDVMNGTFFTDDKQIVNLNVEKYYSERPRWVITLEEIEEFVA